ncbi:hypothetical protein I4U23_005087 [Adineta vaga]|nr:hypothetical protein I4U23_005087 [Adineta vaga]
MSFNNQSEIISTLTNIQSILNHFPFVLLILGTIGFLGNCLTFLHPTIRRNTCSIYSLCNTISDELELLVNLLPDYLVLLGYTISYDTTSSSMCKFLMLLRTFFPQLSISFLILTLIDRYACSCSLTSKWRKINQLKLVPWMILLAILYSLSIAMQALIFYDITPLPISLCITTYSLLTTSSLYRKTFKMAIKQLLAQTKDAVAIILTAICNIQRRPI